VGAATRSKRNACSAQQDEESHMANSRLYEDLKKNIRGQVVVPGDADYDQHRWPGRSSCEAEPVGEVQ
jgi:hypothetical protein